MTPTKTPTPTQAKATSNPGKSLALVLLLALATAGAAPSRPPVRCTIVHAPDGTVVITCPKKPAAVWVGL
jgi:hypothetical protein